MRNSASTIIPSTLLVFVVLVMSIACTACAPKKQTQRTEYLTGRGVTYTVDTTRTRYTIEVVNEYTRDTLVRTIYRETGDERKGMTQLHDTVYIYRVDTVDMSAGSAAPVGEGVMELQQSKERTSLWWVWAIIGICVTVVVLRVFPK